MTIGGLLGIGTSTASCTIWLEKARFAPGEKIKVHFDINNTGCKKPIKSFKTKLFRRITFFTGKANDNTPMMDVSELIYSKKHENPGVNANEQK